MVSTISDAVEVARQNSNGILFDEALAETRFGKFHYLIIFISAILMASIFFETMGPNYVLPVAECDLNITSKQQYGIVSGVWYAGIILTSHLWGFLSDTYGRKRILIIAAFSASIASVLSSLAVNIWQLALFRLLNGLCISGSTATIFAYLGEFLVSKNRSRSMMISSFIFGFICMCLPLIAWLIINQKWSFFIPIIQVTYKPWRLFLLACGIPSLVGGFALIFFPESPKFTFSQGDEAETLKIFQRIYYVNTGRQDYSIGKITPDEEFEQSREKKAIVTMMLRQSVSLFRDHTRSIVLVSMIQLGIYFVCNGMLLFFPDIINQTAINTPISSEATLCEIIEDAIAKNKNNFEVPEDAKTCVEDLDISAYYYPFILEGCYTVGFLIISLIVNYVGRIAIFSFIFFSTGVSGLLIVWISNYVIATYLYVWLLVVGVNVFLLNTVTYDLFPTSQRSLAMSFSFMFGRLASLVGGNVAGLMLENHCTDLYILSGSVLLLSGILTFFIPNILKKQ